MFIEEFTKLCNNFVNNLNQKNIMTFNEKIYINSSDFLDNYLNIINNEENFYNIPILINNLKDMIIELLKDNNPKVMKSINNLAQQVNIY